MSWSFLWNWAKTPVDTTLQQDAGSEIPVPTKVVDAQALSDSMDTEENTIMKDIAREIDKLHKTDVSQVTSRNIIGNRIEILSQKLAKVRVEQYQIGKSMEQTSVLSISIKDRSTSSSSPFWWWSRKWFY